MLSYSNALKVTPRQKKKKKYRKKQNKTIPDTTKQLKRHSAIEASSTIGVSLVADSSAVGVSLLPGSSVVGVSLLPGSSVVGVALIPGSSSAVRTYKEDTSSTDFNGSPNALKVTPRQKKKKKYRKKQNNIGVSLVIGYQP
jgi:hypothetical protein